MIRVFCGCMYAGKSSHLIDEYRNLRSGHKVYFKFVLNRQGSLYETVKVKTHDQMAVDAYLVETLAEVKNVLNALNINSVEYLFLDELQFAPDFDENFLSLIQNRNIFAGCLDMDYLGVPFETSGKVMCMAYSVIKLKAKCSCGEHATHTKRLSTENSRLVEDTGDNYAPVCYTCFMKD